MDIAALSMGMAQAGLKQAVGIRVMTMAKEMAVQQGQDMMKVLQQSMQPPHLGKHIDVKV